MQAYRLQIAILGFVSMILVAGGLTNQASASIVMTTTATPGGTVAPPSNFVSGLPGGGLTTVVGFDTFPNGDPVPHETPVTTQWLSAYGVQFSLVGSPATGELIAKSGDINAGGLIWGDDSISKSNTLAAWNTNYSGAPLTVRITFTPQGNNAAPRAAGFDFTDSPYNDVFTVSAYNTHGTLIGTITSNTADRYYNTPGPTPQPEDRFLGFQYYDTNDPTAGIGYLEYTMVTNEAGGGIHQTIIGNEIDDLTFETRAAPEPATLAMLGLGSLVLVRRRMRLARRR
jgi:hypothetical protein